jgi:hypothetical protein
MTDRGLNIRLRQRSRRAGLMIGVSMALTIALCVASFSVIYSALDQFTTDFVSGEEPTVVSTEAVASGQGNDAQPTATTDANASGDTGEDQAVNPTEPAATSSDNQVEPTSTPSEFTPDYQIDANQSINLRSGPGTNTQVVTTLTIAQPLQYLDEEQASDNPGRDGLAEDQVWMKFRTEDGDEGWVRELDVEEYDPNA